MTPLRSTQRTSFISLLRIISAFAVVVIHVITSSIGNNVGTIPPSTQSSLHLIEALMRWSVPVFFMITGYIFLGVKQECTFASIRKYVLRFLAVLFTVGWLFALMERTFNAGSLQPKFVPLALRDVLLNNLWDHMWYLYAIIGLYLLLPVLKPFVDARPENLPMLCALTFLSGIIIPTLNDIFDVEIAIDFLLVSRYAFYVLFGAWVSKWEITPPRRVCAPAAWAA